MPLPANTVRFGPFQLDLRAAELRSNGTTTKLAEQPFQILSELIEHPGEVVARDELRQRLWHSDTFVDFEHGLNTAVKRLREVLGDSAEHPRYIETIPRRGYRLMVPVEKEVVAATVPEAGVPNVRVLRWKVWLAAAVVGVVLVAVAAGLMWRHRSRRVYALGPSDTIVIADFTNTTGDPVFDDALKQGLTMQLEQSPFLNVVSRTKVQEMLHLMERPADERLTAEVGRELCERAGAKALLTGSIAKLGNQYVIGLSATACKNGDLLAMEQTEAANKEDVLKALGEASSSLRSKLGESLSSIEKSDNPLYGEIPTRSLEALKAFSAAVDTFHTGTLAATIPFLERAVALDPDFAHAYALLAGINYNLGRRKQGKDYATKAFALRDHLGVGERQYVTGYYYLIALGDVERANQENRVWIGTCYSCSSPHTNLSVGLRILGHFEEAASEARERIRVAPDGPAGYVNLALNSFALNQPDVVESAIKQASARGVDPSWTRILMYDLAFFRGKDEEMERLAREATGKEDEPQLQAAQSDTEAFHGRLTRARSFTHRAIQAELRDGSIEGAATLWANAAVREAEFGNPMLARQDVAAALASDPDWAVRALAGLALARIGDTARARAMVEELEKSNPSNTLLNFYWLPTIKAAIELKDGHPDRAVTVLEEATSYELGWATPLDLGTLYPAYLRGQTYLMMRNGAAAASEFQKLLDHHGIVLNYPLGALAHLQLGRAYVGSGDNAKAKAAYQDFLTLWKDADPDIPIRKQAKAEYAKLQ